MCIVTPQRQAISAAPSIVSKEIIVFSLGLSPVCHCLLVKHVVACCNDLYVCSSTYYLQKCISRFPDNENLKKDAIHFTLTFLLKYNIFKYSQIHFETKA